MTHFFLLCVRLELRYGPFPTREAAAEYAIKNKIELRYPIDRHIVECNWADGQWTLEEIMARDG